MNNRIIHSFIHMGVWQGVGMDFLDSLKFHPRPLSPTLLRPAGGPPLKRPYGCFLGGPPTGPAACDCLLPLWTPLAVRLCIHSVVSWSLTRIQRRRPSASLTRIALVFPGSIPGCTVGRNLLWWGQNPIGNFKVLFCPTPLLLQPSFVLPPSPGLGWLPDGWLNPLSHFTMCSSLGPIFGNRASGSLKAYQICYPSSLSSSS
jgi:hypothetical protein